MRGVALLMVMVAVAVLALATTVPLQVQQTQMLREREAELLFIGRQYREAIASYRAATPGLVPQFPKALVDLLEDKRHPMARRHLRQLYRDPFTGEADWVLITEQGAVVGVASRSQRKPLKKAGFMALEAGFTEALSHSEWRFVAQPVAAVAAPASEAPAPTEPQPGSEPPSAEQPDAASERRSACLRGFSQAIAQCMSPSVAATQLNCRVQARSGLATCMRGG